MDHESVGFYSADPCDVYLVMKCSRVVTLPTGIDMATTVIFDADDASHLCLERAFRSNDSLRLIFHDERIGVISPRERHKILDVQHLRDRQCLLVTTRIQK